MDAKKMTAREYLTARGWVKAAAPPDTWIDPVHYGAPSPDEHTVCLNAVDALTIQRARDAAEERAAWVRFAASAGAAMNDCGDWNSLKADEMAADAARYADELAECYRARFAVEIEGASNA